MNFYFTVILRLRLDFGGWFKWDPWSPCECEFTEKQDRHRTCIDPMPLGVVTTNCTGPRHEQRGCTKVPDCSDGR